MKFYFSILLLFVAQQAFPQFNSIECRKEMASINVVRKTTSQTQPIELDLKLLPLSDQLKKKEGSALLASPPLENFSMTSPYGYRSDPFSGEKAFHQGIDLKTNRSAVFSMLHGTVVSVGIDPRMGNFVKVQHGKYESIYGHLSQTLVSLGENVLPGTVLGISGSTGRATGDHLHLTIKKGKEYINPALFIQMISKLSTNEQLITYLSN